MDEMKPLGHAVVGLERSVELKTKELEQLLAEVDRYHKEGTHVPQLEYRVKELKHILRDIMDEYEVDPRNEWVVKAHQLV
mmetsp:Transcript_20107/g.32449  ORF Transcript_20107/g.32449 Transcript_20107/m.32449 type:complete len:80 (-) Transcript_20107:76-315(-)|eukprot:CAMPEP_0178788902 /NCGR_PEP_ID=MMETSP0745-20121128/6623_1 /TAXON_ID=913974 /ORGANISM="Nitzschia punctata, Strain CCMP561" /LENGTH=79 /DNA_ID=CAMNT_0020446825 /DNA_START=94 /DNA_END=333 /DNA_ORIENTATION=+